MKLDSKSFFVGFLCAMAIYAGFNIDVFALLICLIFILIVTGVLYFLDKRKKLQ